MAIYCPRCNAQNADTAQTCYACQSPLTPTGGYQPVQQGYGGAPATTQIPGAEKKVLAGILGIVAGSFGVHKFVLGYTRGAHSNRAHLHHLWHRRHHWPSRRNHLPDQIRRRFRTHLHTEQERLVLKMWSGV
jgi:hypothetical protein